MTFEILKILPILVLTSSIIVLVALSIFYYSKDPHCLRSRLFIIHTTLPMIVVGIGGMIVLYSGGLDLAADIYDRVHFNIIEPLTNALPITMKLLTTIFALLLTFIIVRPRIQIFPIAAYETSGNKYWLSFSVKNISWWDGFDMKAELYSYQIDNKDGRDDKRITDIPLDITAKTSVLGWRFAHSNVNTILVETKDQVFKKNQFKQNRERLELRVRITHPLSRITKVFIREFTMYDIHYGEFSNHKLIRKDQEKIIEFKRELPKVICWRVSEWLKTLEFVFLLIVLIEIGWYVSFTPSNEYIICVASYFFYIAVLVAGIMEIVRQIMQRPMTCELCESSI